MIKLSGEGAWVAGGVEGAQAPSGLWVLMVPGDPLLPGRLGAGQEGRATLEWREAGATITATCQRGARKKTPCHPEANFQS